MTFIMLPAGVIPGGFKQSSDMYELGGCFQSNHTQVWSFQGCYMQQQWQFVIVQPGIWFQRVEIRVAAIAKG